MALAANGGVASASSTLSAKYPPSGAINGDRKGLNWGNGGGWNDATNNLYPDSVQITFAGTRSISEIDVFTLQDNFASPVPPTATMTFSQWGITAYDVQYWDGSAWVTVPGGSVTGNNPVWRSFSFPAVSTDRIRVLVKAELGGYARITEVEAWGVTETTTTLASSLNPATVGTSVTFTASVTGSARSEAGCCVEMSYVPASIPPRFSGSPVPEILTF